MKGYIRKNKCMLLLCVALVILVVGITSFNSAFQGNEAAMPNTKSLQVLANAKASQVNHFLDSKIKMLGLIASMNVFKEAIKHPNDTAKIVIAKDRINELKGVVPGISLMNSEGIVSVGDIDLPGTDYSQHPYFLVKRQDVMFTRYYDPLRKGDYYAIIGPVYDNVDKSKIIGRMAYDISLDEVGALFEENTENDTAEVYLIDEMGLLLTMSKYYDKSNNYGILIQEVKSDGAKLCFGDLGKYEEDSAIEGHKEEIIRYKNYMGDEVFGAHVYMPSINGCVIAEKNTDEDTGSSLVGYITKIFS